MRKYLGIGVLFAVWIASKMDEVVHGRGKEKNRQGYEEIVEHHGKVVALAGPLVLTVLAWPMLLGSKGYLAVKKYAVSN